MIANLRFKYALIWFIRENVQWNGMEFQFESLSNTCVAKILFYNGGWWTCIENVM